MLVSSRKLYARSLLGSGLPFDRKLSLASNLFRSKEAFVFAAGPSLTNVDMNAMKSVLGDSFVICIKQSYELVREFCDVMLLNFCNYQEYDWDNLECPVFWTTFEEDHDSLIRDKGIKCNAAIKVVSNKKGLENTTAHRGSWDDFFELARGRAFWGPGLMYELALPLALALGVRRITLVGWDIGTLDQETDSAFMNDHFYDSNQLQMKTKITTSEIKLVADSTLSLMRWLEHRGVELQVVSDRSLVHRGVKRNPTWLLT